MSGMDFDEHRCVIGFLDALPAHKVSLTLAHNEHRSLYQTVAEYTEDCRDAFVSDDEYEAAISSDELWELHWYPDTPVGFHRSMASSLTALMEALGR